MRFDLPTPDNDTAPFWDAAKDGRFLLRRCLDCAATFFYPRPFCPKCWSERVDWVEASGRAVVYTYSIVVVNDLPPFNERVPYIAAVVDLEEGPRVMTNVVDCDLEAVRVGMPVEVTFRPLNDDITIPVFKPAAAA
jgi:uncharacterized OB-fold protein